MKRRSILLVLGLSLSPLALRAEVITEAEAKSQAEQFLSQRKGKPATMQREVCEHELRRIKGTKAPAAYYIFNDTKGEGFVVMAGDDRLPAVMGYSDNGTISNHTMPPAMAHLLDEYAALVEAVRTGQIDAPLSFAADDAGSDLPIECAPLVETHWDQHEPYNNLVKDNYPTGCVATAISQIMYTHRWPIEGKGSGSATYDEDTHDRINLKGHVYEWDKMLLTTEEYEDNEEAAAAVALLCRDAGYAVEMKYEKDGSAAYAHNVMKALITNFGYKASTIQPLYRDFMTASAWIRAIKTDLAAHHPVYYGAQDPKIGGHAFIADGYDRENRLHINWGWGDQSDGYFHVTSFVASKYVFTELHDVIIGIEPALDGDAGTFVSQPFYKGELSTDIASLPYTNNGTIEFTVNTPEFYNYGHQTVKWNLCLGLFDANNELVTRIASLGTIDLGSFYYGEKNAIECTIPGGCEPGDYSIRAYVREAREGKMTRYEDKFTGFWLGGEEWKSNRLYIQITNKNVLFNTPAPSAIGKVPFAPKPAAIYNLDGTLQPTDWDALRRGVYIRGGKQILKTQ